MDDVGCGCPLGGRTGRLDTFLRILFQCYEWCLHFDIQNAIAFKIQNIMAVNYLLKLTLLLANRLTAHHVTKYLSQDRLV
jgi:hypothetical protein